ncbi:FecR domain-containing protein [Comamonas sp. JUb58]|uniref:FecR domain-containing protein n=1 Tax=Comamonas sp. JUb58 TaxID=2485114 RepID=UPI001060CA6D|nr:FecR domain-containing protein [Comamonas sp. JUb58]TDS83684.1 FecR family protein [Comamonas sp. JUb58]
MPATTTLTLPSGRVISRATADAAADWLTVLMSGDVGAEEQQQWTAWRQAHADHEAAWQHIEAVTGRMKALGPRPAYTALTAYGAGQPASAARRRATRLLLWGGLATGAGVLASRSASWQAQVADYRSATGEQRRLALDDGTQLLLNTGSALNLRFGATERRLVLLSGEIMVTTAHALGTAADPRPLVVETAQGSIRSLGTRFTVRQHAERTEVAVLESAVEIRCCDGAGSTRLLQAGEQTRFSRSTIDAPRAADAQAQAWTRGQLLADEQRLDDFLAELGRYRTGLLRVDPQVAGLRLSGVFPLGDTDRILSTLPSVLPVQVRTRSRYWVTVLPAEAGL